MLYLNVFPLPFALASRERAFVVGWVRAERTPHTQPEEGSEKSSQQMSPSAEVRLGHRASHTWPVPSLVGQPGSASGRSLSGGWAGWCPAGSVWSAACPSRRYCRAAPPHDWTTPGEFPSAAPEMKWNLHSNYEHLFSKRSQEITVAGTSMWISRLLC